MGEGSNKGGDGWLAEALFDVGKLLNHKTPVDADLAQGELVQRVANLTDRQKLAFAELLASRGVELFSTTGHGVSGVEVPQGARYLFVQSLIDTIQVMVKATSGQEPVCEYCLEPVDLENVEDACRQATLWVSGPKSQNTRMRTYTGAHAHRKCIEERLARKEDSSQEELQL